MVTIRNAYRPGIPQPGSWTPTPKAETLADRVRAFMRKRGMTQAEFSKLTGYSEAYLSDFLGNRRHSPAFIDVINGILDAPLAKRDVTDFRKREDRFATLIAEGMTQTQAGDLMGLSPGQRCATWRAIKRRGLVNG